MINSKNKFNSIFFRNFINLVLLIFVFFCISIKKSEALPHEWVGVPKSEYGEQLWDCLLYTSPSPRDGTSSRMPSSA